MLCVQKKTTVLKSISIWVAQIARILIFFLISKESLFSLTETFVGIKNFILSDKNLKKEDFFASKMREENLGVIEKRF